MIKIEYNKETKKFQYNPQLKDDFEITEEDISQNLATSSNVVSSLHDFQKNGLWFDIKHLFIG